MSSHTLAIAGYTATTVRDFVGRELALSEWLTIEQERVDRFAECTEDRQWIHLDAERARRESPLGATVVHGFLLLSLCGHYTLALGVVPDGFAQVINYGLERVRFVTPVPAGGRVRDRVVLLAVEEKGGGRLQVAFRHTLELEGAARPAMIADSLVLLVPPPAGANR